MEYLVRGKEFITSQQVSRKIAKAQLKKQFFHLLAS